MKLEKIFEIRYTIMNIIGGTDEDIFYNDEVEYITLVDEKISTKLIESLFEEGKLKVKPFNNLVWNKTCNKLEGERISFLKLKKYSLVDVNIIE